MFIELADGGFINASHIRRVISVEKKSERGNIFEEWYAITEDGERHYIYAAEARALQLDGRILPASGEKAVIVTLGISDDGLDQVFMREVPVVGWFVHPAASGGNSESFPWAMPILTDPPASNCRVGVLHPDGSVVIAYEGSYENAPAFQAAMADELMSEALARQAAEPPAE